MITNCVWRGHFARLEFLRYLDGGVVVAAIVNGRQWSRHGYLEGGKVLRRFTSCIGLGRELGERNSLIALKSRKENDGSVPTLIGLDVIKAQRRRIVPHAIGQCLVYELTDEAQALANDQVDLVEA